MTTAPVTTPSAAASSTSSSSTTGSNALNKLSSDLNSFLTLLTTQLKNQDPLSPLDSTQFTAQLVAFTGVEQQINTNTKLDSLIGVDKATQLTSAANFIGNTVQAPSSQVWLDTTGTASQIGYNLPSQASAVVLTVMDSTGAVVSSGNAPVTKGDNVVTWDGKDGSGNALASGVYSVTVSALDQSQQPMTGITTSIIGTVTNVTSDPTAGTELSIGGVTVPLSSVTSVKKA
jgi:flagellar basal-body rod modification protein FlgD